MWWSADMVRWCRWVRGGADSCLVCPSSKPSVPHQVQVHLNVKQEPAVRFGFGPMPEPQPEPQVRFRFKLGSWGLVTGPWPVYAAPWQENQVPLSTGTPSISAHIKRRSHSPPGPSLLAKKSTFSQTINKVPDTELGLFDECVHVNADASGIMVWTINTFSKMGNSICPKTKCFKTQALVNKVAEALGLFDEDVHVNEHVSGIVASKEKCFKTPAQQLWLHLDLEDLMPFPEDLRQMQQQHEPLVGNQGGRPSLQILKMVDDELAELDKRLTQLSKMTRISVTSIMKLWNTTKAQRAVVQACGIPINGTSQLTKMSSCD